MAEVVSTNEFKTGMHIELEGSVWRIVDFQHVKPGKGGAFVRTKVKSINSGSVVDKTFRAGEKFARVYTEVKNMQYLYDSGDEVVFMDEQNYEQLSLPHASLEAELPYMQPSTPVQLLFVGGRPSGVQLPSSIELAVTDTEPGVKGDTVSNVTKPATLETGAVVQVPLFVNVGDPDQGRPSRRPLHLPRLRPGGAATAGQSRGGGLCVSETQAGHAAAWLCGRGELVFQKHKVSRSSGTR